MNFRPWLIGGVVASILLFFIRRGAVSAGTETDSNMSKTEAEVYIVYMEKRDENPEALESHHLDTLASVVGSQEVAEEAILYSYKHGVNGFSAKLTNDQVKALSEKPGVLQVVPSRTQQLHGNKGPSGGASLH